MTAVPKQQLRRCSPVPLALVVALGVISQPAAADRPPVGRTYYALAVGLETGYDIQDQCFEFHDEKLCSLDGLICGSWQATTEPGREMELSFDLTTVADGDLMQLQGAGRLDSTGRKSSIAGTGSFGPVEGRDQAANFSFAAREVGRSECLDLLEDAPGLDDGEVIVGSGIVASEEREVSDFHALLAGGVGRIEIRHGPTESLRITADDNLLPILTSEVDDGRLILGSDSRFETANDIHYEITVREFDEITLAGAFVVDISGLDTERFAVDLSGATIVDATGRTGHQEIRIAGVSRYDARDLQSRTTRVDIAGPSHATVRVSDLLEGTAVGGAMLEYIGNPTVHVRVDLISTLRRIG